MLKKLFLFAVFLASAVLSAGNLLKNPFFTEKAADGTPANWGVRCTNKTAGVVSDGKNIVIDTDKAGSAVNLIQWNMDNKPGKKVFQFYYSGTGEVRAYFEWRVKLPNGKTTTRWSGPVWKKASDTPQLYQFAYDAGEDRISPYLVINIKDKSKITLSGFYYGNVTDKSSGNLLGNPAMRLLTPQKTPFGWIVRCKNPKAALSVNDGSITLDTANAGGDITLLQRNLDSTPGKKIFRMKYKGEGEIEAFLEWKVKKADGKMTTAWSGPVWKKASGTEQVYQCTYNPGENTSSPHVVIALRGKAKITISDLYYGAAPEYNIRLVPAEIRRHGELVMVRGFTQGVSIFLHTALPKVEKDVDIKLDFELPAGVKLAGGAVGNVISGNTMSYKLPPRLVLTPGQGGGEWKCTYVSFDIPKDIQNGARVVITPTVDGKKQLPQSYTMRFVDLPETPAPKLKKLRHMIYDYGYFTIPDKDGTMSKFFAHVGFNYANHGTWKDMLVSDYVHNSELWNDNLPLAPSVDGKIYKSLNHGDPQSFISKGADAVAGAQIRKIAENCKSSGSIIHLDYEPFGYSDFFTEESINKFLGQTGITRDKFDNFRAQYAKEWRNMIFNATPENKEIFYKWLDFTTNQSVEFIRILKAELKKYNPDIKLEITQTNSCGPRDSASLAYGHDNSAMALVCDTVQPQIYNGYDDAYAKYTILRMREWKQRVNSLNPQCKIMPLLLKSWSGAKSGNTPQMIYLQALGGFAEGMDGIGWYYVQNLDGDDMLMLHKLSCDVAKYEDFYTDGVRCDKEFTFTGMPLDEKTLLQKPHLKKAVNSKWHYTAHKYNGKILLTLFNLSDKPLKFNWKYNGKSVSRQLAAQTAEFIII
ncbi:MAG: hypothetical protein E7057_07315 [Lentisphaerae bacterium]|nr:hypothetical protein [Lentisphaerota bacterium]